MMKESVAVLKAARCSVPCVLLVCILVWPIGMQPIAAGAEALPLERHFARARALPGGQGTAVDLEEGSFQILREGSAFRRIAFPVEAGENLQLDLVRFNALSPTARFAIGSTGGDVPVSTPEVALFRGTVVGAPGSYAYIGFGQNGTANGYVVRADGSAYFLATAPRYGSGDAPTLTIQRGSAFAELPPFAEVCGVEATSLWEAIAAGAAGISDTSAGPVLATLAIDADSSFFRIFGSIPDAQTYILQLVGAISDIYIRDVNIALSVEFLRLWPFGGEPFAADDLGGFADYWFASEDPSPYNYIHLMSGRRDLSYGGIAYLTDVCAGSGFAISGFLNGSFPTPVGPSSISTWDLIVMAHEMGHNTGTLHTHDGYDPTIDDCGNGVPARGTIMSYCHIHPGYTSNIDLRFHARVQEVMEGVTALGACLPFDCNGNGVADSTDLNLGTSLDTNGNGIPDECEDCDGNAVLDPLDILLGAADVNGNGVPDRCEPDCNGNTWPDEHEVKLGLASDLNGNNVPDLCEPDCDADGIPDFRDIELGLHTDYDRDNVPDLCQDCNGNVIADWLDLERQHNLYVLDLTDIVREYHQASGYPIRSYAGTLSDPYDAVFGSDRRLYVASFSNSRILRIDPDLGTTAIFVPTGSGGLSGASGVVFGSDGNLYVSSRATNSVIAYDGSTGAPVGTFVSPGSGGLSFPYGLEFGPNGNLFVTSSNHAILEYSGTTGTFIRAFVAPGSGGLSGPRGLAFKPDGNLLVTSYNNDRVLQYQAGTGAYVGVFNDEVVPTSPWGIRVGPNGNVYVVRSAGTIRVLEYNAQTGRYYRAIVRGDDGLPTPTGLAFRPASAFDCNQNGVFDSCDIAGGFTLDLNSNGVPDECENCADSDGDGFADPGPGSGSCLVDNCPDRFNPDQSDSDADGVGDTCDVCPGANDKVDTDLDGTPDGCDLCLGFDDAADADLDGVPDGCDACAGFDDLADADLDGAPDDCDVCPGLDDASDLDGDGVPDGCDACLGFDDAADADLDGVPDGCDACAGFDDSVDGDSDGAPDACDNCPGTANGGQEDFDGDGKGDPCDSCAALVTPGFAFVRSGDVNVDGNINSSDIINAVNYIFKSGPAPQPITEAGDVNCDGSLTAADIIALVAYVFKSGAPPCDVCAIP